MKTRLAHTEHEEIWMLTVSAIIGVLVLALPAAALAGIAAWLHRRRSAAL